MSETVIPSPSAWLYGEDFAGLRRALADARGRSVDFDQAWPVALHAVNLSPETRAAAMATRPAWRRAYNGSPATDGELRVARLAGDIDREWIVAA